MKRFKSKLKLLLISSFVLVTFTHFTCSKDPDISKKDPLIVGGPEETWVSYKFGDEGAVNKVTSWDSLRVDSYFDKDYAKATWRLTNNKVEAERTMCDLQFDNRGKDRFHFTFYWEPVAGGGEFISNQSYNLNTTVPMDGSQTLIKPTWGYVDFAHSYEKLYSYFSTVKLNDYQQPRSTITIEHIDYNTSVSPAVKSHASGKFYISSACPGSSWKGMEIHGRFNKVPIGDGSDDSKKYVSFGRGNLQGSVCQEDGFAGNSHPTRTIQVIYEKIIGTKVSRWVAYPEPRDREWLGCSTGVGYKFVYSKYQN